MPEGVGARGAIQNSIALAEVVGAVKGGPAAQTLVEAWRGMVADLVQYAQGLQSAASADLDRRRPVIAAQLSFASLPPAAVDDLLRTHLQSQLTLAIKTV